MTRDFEAAWRNKQRPVNEEVAMYEFILVLKLSNFFSRNVFCKQETNLNQQASGHSQPTSGDDNVQLPVSPGLRFHSHNFIGRYESRRSEFQLK